MTFEERVGKSDVILAEGAVIERINRDRNLVLDQYILNAGMVYHKNERDFLKRIYEGYIEVGRRHDLPFLVLAPTWRATRERVDKSNYAGRDRINEDCLGFLSAIRSSYGEYSESVYIGGLMAPRGDAYKPEEALSEDEAEKFHKDQAMALARGRADFILASTIPSLTEASGMAKAMAASHVPYVISFVIRPDGTLLDGTPIHEAIEKIDSNTAIAPAFFSVNCVHPSVLMEALERIPESAVERIRAFQGNTSKKSPEELDNLEYLDTADPEEYAREVVSIHKRFGIKILGGCCGTDHNHISAMADMITGM